MCVGLRLDDAGTEHLSWLDLLAFCQHSPVGSALHASVDPDYTSIDTALLVSMEYRLRWLQWAKTDDAAKKRNVPEPIKLIVEPPEYTAMTVDEMDAFLGRSFRSN
jgi:hypothetical protein